MSAPRREQSSYRSIDYHEIFEHSAVSLWVEDISKLRLALSELRRAGVTDIGRYLGEHPEFSRRAVDIVRVVDVNHATLRLYGVDEKSALLGPLKKTLDMQEPRVIRAINNDIESIFDGRPDTAKDSYAFTPAGKRIDIAIFSHIPTKPGSEDYMLVSVLDMTEQRRAERAVKESEERFRSVVELSVNGIMILDASMNVVFWNEAASRILGYPPVEIIGRSAAMLFPPEERESFFRSSGPSPAVARLAARNGQIVEVEYTCSGWVMGGADYRTVILIDMTERRALEAELLRAQRLESIGTLAGGIAHDLNNALTPVLNGVEALALGAQDEHSRRILEIIRMSALRGASIIRQVLNFAIGAKGEQSEVQMKHILREIEQIIGETFPRSIKVRSEIAEDLWPVSGDVGQLHQVLMNICANARDAMPAGGTITLIARNITLDENHAHMHVDARPGAYVELGVEDTGRGMTPEVLAKIFDPFFTTKETGRGTGLGLPTARSVVKAHGGFINVSSAVEKGSTFWVYLPALKQEPIPSLAGPDEQLPRGHGELVLLVDDESAVREVTKAILQAYGYFVATAQDGVEALSTYVEHKKEIRIAVVDAMMPYLDGAGTIRGLRRMGPVLPIILTSGLGANPPADQGSKTAADAFLPKPYTAAQLVMTVRRLLDEAAVQ